ncbi:MAG: hypothetical protein UI647_08870 [Negativibacillus sp.]
MNNQEKKRYLLRCRHLNRKINALLREKERLQDLVCKVSPNLSGMPRGGSSEREASLARLADIDSDIDRHIDEYVDTRKEIAACMDQLEDGRLYELMRLYYLADETWEQVAEDMRLDYRWILRLHGRALEELTIESHYHKLI